MRIAFCKSGWRCKKRLNKLQQSPYMQTRKHRMKLPSIQAAFERLVNCSEPDFKAELTALNNTFRDSIPISKSGESPSDVRSAFNALLHGVSTEDPYRRMCRAAALYTIATERNFSPTPGNWPRLWRNLNDDAQGWCKRVLQSQLPLPTPPQSEVNNLMTAKGYVSCLAEDFKPSDLPIIDYELDMGLLGRPE